MVFAVASIRAETPGRKTPMTATLEAPVERSLGSRFAALADEERVARAAAALEANGMTVLRASDAADARRIVLGLIPTERRSTTVPRKPSR
jgi:hypothetical protein